MIPKLRIAYLVCPQKKLKLLTSEGGIPGRMWVRKITWFLPTFLPWKHETHSYTRGRSGVISECSLCCGSCVEYRVCARRRVVNRVLVNPRALDLRGSGREGKVIVKCGRGCVKRIPRKLTVCGFSGNGRNYL